MSTVGDEVRRAREAAGLSLRALAAATPITPGHLSLIENGKRQPSQQVIDRLVDMLGVPLGDAPAQLKGDAGRLVDDPSALAPADAVAAGRDAIVQLVQWDGRHGGAGVIAPAIAATQGVRAAANRVGPYSRDLLSVAAELIEVAAWCAYDADRHGLSQALIAESLMLADLAGDTSLQALAWGHVSMVTNYLNRDAESLAAADRIAITPATPGAVAALAELRRARAFAGLGDTEGTTEAMTAAWRHLDRGDNGDTPPWAWWVTDTELAWHAGMTRLALGRPGEAIPDLERAYSGIDQRWNGGSIRTAAAGRARLAYATHRLDAYITLRAWRDSEHALTDMVVLLPAVNSPRTVNRAHRVAAMLAEHPAAPGWLREAAREM